MGSRERLTRVLGRERLKDTSLDYGLGANGGRTERFEASRANSARAYAERRGLVPESEIVLRERAAEVPRAEAGRPRRGLFAGLKLDAGPAEVTPSRAGLAGADGRATGRRTGWCSRWGSMRGPGRTPSGCARPGCRCCRTRPRRWRRPIAHLKAQLPGFGQDLDAALTRTPRLVHGAGTEAGLAALIEAGRGGARSSARSWRTRAREAVRAWSRAGAGLSSRRGRNTTTWRSGRSAGGWSNSLKELKRDPQLDSVLRQRGQQLGVADGSRLARVVQSQGIDRELTRELGLRHSRGLGLGR